MSILIDRLISEESDDSGACPNTHISAKHSTCHIDVMLGPADPSGGGGAVARQSAASPNHRPSGAWRQRA